MLRRNFLQLGLSASTLSLLSTSYLGCDLFLSAMKGTTADVGTKLLAELKVQFFSGPATDPFHSKMTIKELMALPQYLYKFDSTSGVSSRLGIPLPAHSIILNSDKKEGYAIPLRKAGAVRFDLNSPEKHNEIFFPQNNFEFYGHGCLLDSDYLLLSEQNKSAKMGVVTIRDTKTLKLVDRFPSGGFGPHEIKLLKNSNILLVCNGDSDSPKSSSNVSVIDLKSFKILSTMPSPDPTLKCRHLDVTENGRFVIAPQKVMPTSENFCPFPMIGSLDDKLEVIKSPTWHHRFLSLQLLSVAVDSTSMQFLVTCPSGGSASIWSLTEKRMLQNFQFPQASGCTFLKNANCFILASADPTVQTRNLQTGIRGNQLVHAQNIARAILPGSHLTPLVLS